MFSDIHRPLYLENVLRYYISKNLFCLLLWLHRLVFASRYSLREKEKDTVLTSSSSVFHTSVRSGRGECRKEGTVTTICSFSKEWWNIRQVVFCWDAAWVRAGAAQARELHRLLFGLLSWKSPPIVRTTRSLSLSSESLCSAARCSWTSYSSS